MQLKFSKTLIADERFESAAFIDVNNDGHLDIVSGAYWYEGPDFEKVHPVGPVLADGEYFDDFSTIPLDISGNGL
ncbi:MAG: VCBS repeat-containing protein, partial [Spirochaetales bacterium]|nr:VCBS repeat-containing protein [Spirochaetales bacterium]